MGGVIVGVLALVLGVDPGISELILSHIGSMSSGTGTAAAAAAARGTAAAAAAEAVSSMN